MNIRKKLSNPFLLFGKGFALGAVLFWTSHGALDEAGPAAATAEASLLEASRAQL